MDKEKMGIYKCTLTGKGGKLVALNDFVRGTTYVLMQDAFIFRRKAFRIR